MLLIFADERIWGILVSLSLGAIGDLAIKMFGFIWIEGLPRWSGFCVSLFLLSTIWMLFTPTINLCYYVLTLSLIGSIKKAGLSGSKPCG